MMGRKGRTRGFFFNGFEHGKCRSAPAAWQPYGRGLGARRARFRWAAAMGMMEWVELLVGKLPGVSS